jgi:hypothetical protein
MKHIRNKLIRFKHWVLSIIKRVFLRKKLANERLDWQEFYEVMQTYRHAPMAEQHKVINAFEDVKQWIRENYS